MLCQYDSCVHKNNSNSSRRVEGVDLTDADAGDRGPGDGDPEETHQHTSTAELFSLARSTYLLSNNNYQHPNTHHHQAHSNHPINEQNQIMISRNSINLKTSTAQLVQIQSKTQHYHPQEQKCGNNNNNKVGILCNENNTSCQDSMSSSSHSSSHFQLHEMRSSLKEALENSNGFRVQFGLNSNGIECTGSLPNQNSNVIKSEEVEQVEDTEDSQQLQLVKMSQDLKLIDSKNVTHNNNEKNRTKFNELIKCDCHVKGLGKQNRNLCQSLMCRLLWLQDQLGGAGTPDSLYENAYLMLDPELQPISPATDIPESMQIFEDHKRLAQEYLQTQTEIACLLQAKEDLEKQLAEESQFGQRGLQRLDEFRELHSENISLVELHKSLKRQLEIMKGPNGRNKNLAIQSSSDPPDVESDDPHGWVLIRPPAPDPR